MGNFLYLGKFHCFKNAVVEVGHLLKLNKCSEIKKLTARKDGRSNHCVFLIIHVF